jgi:hypothetical protein
MTDLERQQKRQAKLRPGRQFQRLKALYLKAEEQARIAFRDWLRKQK